MEKDEQLNKDIRDAGLKVTLPRIKILQILETNEKRHLSAEEVYRKLLEANEDVGLATVYRVLTQFESANLVTRHNFEGDHSVFELNHGDHHDHIVCVECGQVVEFVDDVIEQRQEEIARANGFTISDHSLILYGVCSKEHCSSKQK